jgi:hypothetical protein
MGKLIYMSNVSLDGYIEDEAGSFAWSAPDGELFAFITDLLRPIGTYRYLPVRASLVRHDGPLGDRPQPGRSVRTDGRLRQRLAGSGQGGLLQYQGDGADRQDADRPQLRPCLGARHESRFPC